MKITIDKLRELNACAIGLTLFVQRWPDGAESADVFDALAESKRWDWLLWLEGRAGKATDAQFASAAQARPGYALAYACKRLDDAQFAAAAQAAPGCVLEYKHACKHLNDAQFASAAQARPGYALAYKHACARHARMAAGLDKRS